MYNDFLPIFFLFLSTLDELFEIISCLAVWIYGSRRTGVFPAAIKHNQDRGTITTSNISIHMYLPDGE